MKCCRVQVRTEHDVWIAAATSSDMAQEIGLSVVDCARVETAVSEMAHNIVVHAQEGTITIQFVRQKQRYGLQVRAIDRGPGIRNISQAMQDGFTTKNSLGIGLGVTKRMMDDLSIRSHPGWGTIVTATKWKR